MDDLYDQLQIILPDILPIIAGYSIDRVSVFKTFRVVNRLFKSCADKMFPTGDIDFANHFKTIYRKYHMVPDHYESILLDPSNISVFPNNMWDLFNFILLHTHLYDFDEMVVRITPHLLQIGLIHDEGSHCIQKISEKVSLSPANVLAGLWILEQIHGKYAKLTPLIDALVNDVSVRMLCRESVVSLQCVIDNPQYEWDYDALSSNTNITKEFYLANQDKNWNINSMIFHLPFEFAKSLVREKDDIRRLLIRRDVTWEFLTENFSYFDKVGRVYIISKPDCVRMDHERWKQIMIGFRQTYDISVYYGIKHKQTWKNYDPNIHKFKLEKHDDFRWLSCFDY